MNALAPFERCTQPVPKRPLCRCRNACFQSRPSGAGMRQGVLLAARPSRPVAGARAAFPGVDAYWSHSAAEALDRLGSRRNGLRANEAARRLQLHGPNEVEDATGTASVRLLLRQFQSPLVLILLAGAGQGAPRPTAPLRRTWLLDRKTRNSRRACVDSVNC